MADRKGTMLRYGAFEFLETCFESRNFLLEYLCSTFGFAIVIIAIGGAIGFDALTTCRLSSIAFLYENKTTKGCKCHTFIHKEKRGRTNPRTIFRFLKDASYAYAFNKDEDSFFTACTHLQLRQAEPL